MVHLVEEAEHSRAPAQRLADRYASYFLPLVLACAGGVYLWAGDVVRAVAVLVVACPCALVLATPTAITAGIGRLARRGILVKGGAALEALGRSRVLLLDKTGTLTLARLRLAEALPAEGRTAAEVLFLAAALEQVSEHPVARAIVEAGTGSGRALPCPEAVTVLPGLGIRGLVDGQAVSIGSPAFIESEGVALPQPLQGRLAALQDDGRSVVAVAVAGRFAGLLAMADEVRPEAQAAVARLRELYRGRLCMLTGDGPGPARRLAAELGIDDVRSGLLPEDKMRTVRESRQAGAVVAMVGDGVNDAAALAAADVGIAVTDVGTDVAVAAAGIALHGRHHLDQLAEAVAVARQVLRTVRQNLVLFALGTNVLSVVAAGVGVVGPVAAAVLHQASSLLVVGNSLRLLWAGADLASWRARFPHQARSLLRRCSGPVMAGGLVLYALGGLYAVSPGEVGVVRWCGRPGAPVAPGLHYRLPWPVSRLDRVRLGAVERIEVGFRTNPRPGQVTGSYEWNIQHREGRYRSVPEESLATCGDQRLLDVSAVVHLRVADPVGYLFAAANREAVLLALAQGAVGEVLGRRDAQSVLTAERSLIEAEIGQALARTLSGAALGVRVGGIHLQDVHPPLEVVAAYRRTVDALEEKAAATNRAEAYAFEQLPRARGQADATRSAAAAFRAESVGRADGEAALFAAQVAARGSDPAARSVADFRLYVEGLETVLADRRLVVADPRVPGAVGLTLLPPGALARSGAIAAEAVQAPAASPEGKLGTEVTR
jgi:Cu+-exporting ATPase